MVAVLALSVVLLLAYVGSSWATIARKNERIALLKNAVRIERELPRLWEHDDEPTKTLPSIAPRFEDGDATDPCVMVLP
jgi:hypothetical protein